MSRTSTGELAIASDSCHPGYQSVTGTTILRMESKNKIKRQRRSEEFPEREFRERVAHYKKQRREQKMRRKEREKNVPLL